ncbi:MAG: hypothetical protein ABTQ34_07625 [Bdellovibrionales bacterium]
MAISEKCACSDQALANQLLIREMDTCARMLFHLVRPLRKTDSTAHISVLTFGIDTLKAVTDFETSSRANHSNIDRMIKLFKAHGLVATVEHGRFETTNQFISEEPHPNFVHALRLTVIIPRRDKLATLERVLDCCTFNLA